MNFQFDKKTRHRSLCVYGPPVTGKTEMLVTLLKAGKKIWYLDLDGNTGPLEAQPPEVTANLRYIRITDGLVDGNVVNALSSLRSGKMTVCTTHGVNNCPPCKKESKEFLVFSLSMMEPNDILCVDSFSVVHNSVLRKVIAHNGLDPTDMARMDQTFYAAVSNLTAPLWELLCKPPAPVDTIILTHSKNKAPTLVKDPPPPYWVPNAGSVNFSADSAGKLLGALWLTQKDQPPRYGSKRTDRLDAFTRGIDPAELAGLSLGDAAVKYFTKD